MRLNLLFWAPVRFFLFWAEFAYPRGYEFPRVVRVCLRVDSPSFLFINRDNKQQLLFPEKLWHYSKPEEA